MSNTTRMSGIGCLSGMTDQREEFFFQRHRPDGVTMITAMVILLPSMLPAPCPNVVTLFILCSHISPEVL